jgi:hypothetical protein
VEVTLPSYSIQEGGRFAALVDFSQLSKRDPLLFRLQKSGRFAPVVVVPNCCPIPEGGRFAPVVVVPNCHLIQKGGHFAAIDAVPIPIVQKSPIILPAKKKTRFAPVVVVPNYCPIVAQFKKAAASRP